MINRILKCLKAWGAGMVMLGISLVFLYPKFQFGSDLWKIPLSLFFTFFPVLLLFDLFLLKPLRFSWKKRLLCLWLLWLIAELEFYFLPYSFTQVTFLGSRRDEVFVLFSSFSIACCLVYILKPKKEVIIKQKEF